MDNTKILSVDTSQGVDNLQKLRAEISELKKAMESLKIGSDEYIKVNDELQESQKRLRAVMTGTNVEVANADGSFNSLNTRLARLKEQWKATTDEVKRSELGAEINAVKAQINGMNESIGNYQHNVGNYSNSIVDAFTRMGIAATTLDNPLKKIGVDITSITDYVKVLVVSFQQLNMGNVVNGFKSAATSVGTFVKSLSAVKAAVLATGLGALLVLIGELIAHWDDLSDAVGRWIAKTNEGLISADQLRKGLADTNKEINFELDLMRALGKSEQDVTEMNILFIQQEIEKQKAIQAQNKELADNAFWWWTRVSAMRAYEVGGEEISKLEADLDKLLDKQAIIMKVLSQNTETATKTTKTYTTARRELLNTENEIAAVMRETDSEMQKTQEQELQNLEKALELQQQEIDKRKTAEELEIEEYERKKAILEEYHLSTEELEANHWDRMNEIRFEREQKEYEELQRQRKIEKEQNDKQAADYKKQMNARKDATKYFVNSASDLFGKLSLAMGENTKMGKGFAIASATIDTIASAVAGFRAGYNQWKDTGYMSFMAPIQGAINATAALVAGYAQVQKIRSVDTSGNDSGGGGMATALAMPNIEGLSSPVDYTRQVTTETEQEEMNRSSRVYILESDIQESGNRVRIRENETTF